VTLFLYEFGELNMCKSAWVFFLLSGGTKKEEKHETTIIYHHSWWCLANSSNLYEPTHEKMGSLISVQFFGVKACPKNL